MWSMLTDPRLYFRECANDDATRYDRVLFPWNHLTYLHYKRCQATNRWPDDPLVAANAATIAEIERECRETKQLQTLRNAIVEGLATGISPHSGEV